jgi:lysophospholipid acyltransferase (LPLAT)-like uncharacterized protein
MVRVPDAVLFAVVPRVAYWYIRLLGATMRLEFRGRDVLERLRRERGAYILAFWHSRFVLMPFAYPGGRLVVLSSEHRDSRLLAAVLRRFGLATAWGSSTAGGAAGMRQLLRHTREGHDVGFTPDGPRGPRRQAKAGVIAAARLAGLPIVPVAYSARPARRLRSWDRTLVPRPFARAVFLYGEPLDVPREASPGEQELWRRRLEAALDALTDAADDAVGLAREGAPRSAA